MNGQEFGNAFQLHDHEPADDQIDANAQWIAMFL